MSKHPLVIMPYLFEDEIRTIVSKLNNTFIDYRIEKDLDKIGPDMMYQKMWNKTDRDVIILHADMLPLEDDLENKWYEDICSYADKYPEAGILGSKLLYPAMKDGKYLVQHAGGKFENDIPTHFGCSVDLFTNHARGEPVLDKGQFDCVREVAWSTFGGIYIRRSVLNDVGDFDSSYEWSYNRDVDYCLKARSKGYKIYQTPATLLHFESRDVKRIRTEELVMKEMRNLEKLQANWKNTEFYKTLDRIVE